MPNAHGGYFAPDSIVAKLHSDPALIVGGIRALMEQALHPGAMAGVAKYSDFRDDAWGRLRRTGEYVSLVTYGPVSEVDRAAERVRMIHHRLGLDSQEELLWVHTSMVDAFIDIARRSGMRLSTSDIDDYLSQMVLFAQLVGINRESVPDSLERLESYMQEMQPKLMASEEAKRTAESGAIGAVSTCQIIPNNHHGDAGRDANQDQSVEQVRFVFEK